MAGDMLAETDQPVHSVLIGGGDGVLEQLSYQDDDHFPQEIDYLTGRR